MHAFRPTSAIIILIFFLCPAIPTLFAIPAGAQTYFVDAINGNDGNPGTAEDLAWRSVQKVEDASVTFQPGDTVKFKCGQTFLGRLRYYGPSGTPDSPVTFSSYGTGPRPVLTVIDVITAQWTDQGNNKWSTPIAGPTSRLWKNGVEQKKATPVNFGHTWEEFGLRAGISWAYDNNTLYVYSDTDPSADIFTGNTNWNVIYMRDKAHIHITGLDLRGAINEDISLPGCHHITIDHCAIGMYSAGGINLAETDHILIERNTFDSGFRLRFEGVASYTGTDARGVNDAISSYRTSTDNEIRYNDFMDWSHAAISLEITNNAELGVYRIHHNFFTASDISYGRAIGFSGTNVHDIEVYRNYFFDLITPSQLNGRDNHIHHNWFEKIKDTRLKDGEQGQAITLSPYNGNVNNNLIEYNTFSNGEGPCVELIAYDREEDDISGNTLQENLFINCGTSPWYPAGLGKGIYIQSYSGMRANNFFNNIFSSSLTQNTIFHRDAEVTPVGFNDRNTMAGDAIHGNGSLAELADQGAGILDTTTIGVNGAEPTEPPVPGPTHDALFCPALYLLL